MSGVYKTAQRVTFAFEARGTTAAMRGRRNNSHDPFTIIYSVVTQYYNK